MSEDRGVRCETVGLVYRGDLLLLIKKENERLLNDFCVPPGGGLDECDGGCYEKCVIRELGEEVGIRATAIRELGSITFDNSERVFGDEKPGTKKDRYVKFFEVGEFEGEPENRGVGEPFWCDRDRLEELIETDMPKGDMYMYQWIDEARRTGKTFVGVIKHKIKEVDEAGTSVNYYARD